MSVIHVNTEEEFKNTLSSGNAIVDFSAIWCGPCRRVEPVFKELASANPDVKFVHIDIDEASEFMPNELEHVSGVPHFDIYQDGKKIGQFSGANIQKLKEAVEKLNKSKKESQEPEKAKEEKKTIEENKPEEKESEKAKEEEKPAEEKMTEEKELDKPKEEEKEPENPKEEEKIVEEKKTEDTENPIEKPNENSNKEKNEAGEKDI